MGSFNHKCNFSQLPAKCGDRIVVLVGVRMTKDVMDADGFAPGSSFTPISVPIRGEYNDYGGIENVDMTPGIEALEKYFGMEVGELVDHAERITCGCERQIGDDYEKICNLINSVKGSSYHKEHGLELSYIMEHEAVFDDLIAMNNLAIKDREYWRLPHRFLEDLGYTKNVIGEHNHYEVIKWTHDNLLELKEECYVWKTKDFNDYGKTSHTLADLCEYIGAEVPEKYNKKYYEERFKADIAFLREKEQHPGNLDWIFRHSEDNNEYSFLRHAEFGLFHRGENSGCTEYLICSLGEKDTHMDIKYMKEIIEVGLLYDAMNMLQMTWGNTNYYRQDINYDLHVRFLEKCLSVVKEKKRKYEEE